ncbi:MAG: Maf family protein [Fimbriimonadales bacterium]|nr:Maf family protein [Fimbriimonadales bacterium]
MPQWPFPIVLASASPRRQELLRTIVDRFEVDPAHLDEHSLVANDPWQTAENLALAKALEVAPRHPGSVVVAGDTVVAYEESPGRFLQLAKPADEEEAVRMLRALSGREHCVVTGMALATPWGREAFSETSVVRFRPLSEVEIEAYVRTGEPMDKAGAYAIQGGAAAWVERVEGPIDNVIGLPTRALRERLERIAGYWRGRSE